MQIDDFVQTLDSISRLISALALPVVVIVLIARFGRPLQRLIDRSTEVNIKGLGLEASLKERQAQATSALVAASVSRSAGSGPEAVTEEAQAAVAAVSDTIPRIANRTDVTLLWVDDNPGNNLHERRAFEAAGVRVVLATSTADGVALAQTDRFDAIISDMGRGLDRRAGYDLLDKVRKAGVIAPFFIYAGSKAAEHVDEARRRGADGVTNRPDELFRMVMNAVGDARTSRPSTPGFR